MKLILLLVTQMFWLFMGSVCTVSRLSLFPLCSPQRIDGGWARSCEGTWLGQLTPADQWDNQPLPNHIMVSSKSFGKGYLSLWHLSSPTAINANGVLLSRKQLKTSYWCQGVNKFLFLLCMHTAFPVKLSQIMSFLLLLLWFSPSSHWEGSVQGTMWVLAC